MTCSITINSSAAACALAAEKGYSFVFAKGVDTAGSFGNANNGVEYSTAWFVLNPNEIGRFDHRQLGWYGLLCHCHPLHDKCCKTQLDPNGIAIELQPGCYYQVDMIETLNI
jgi:hypothetical protein